jgi:sodium-dependent dicarboxylate transporter 2/3/5
MTDRAAPSRAARLVRRIGLLAGPAAALLLYSFLPDSFVDAAGKDVAFSHAGRATLAMMAWMAIWWMTEAVEIEATALLPIVAFPLLGVMTLGDTTANYGADVIFLFLGGFVLALAIQRWGLDKRIAFLTLRLVGTKPGGVIAGCMGATALMSMWVSNTATAAMMVPIALSVVDLVLVRRTGKTLREAGGIPRDDRDNRNFAMGLLLCIAYAASIGGVATLIGSPPNLILARFMSQQYGVDVSFARWLVIGLPTALIFLPLAWLLIVKLIFPTHIGEIEGGRDFVDTEYRKLGPLNRGERATLIVFAVTVLLWIFRPLLADIELGDVRPLRALSDAGIAVGAALALFLFPVDREKGIFASDWSTAVRLPWGVLILFGGGLALAAATEVNGVAAFIGSLAKDLGGWPVLAVVLGVVALTTFMSELTSNTAQVATMLPIVAALAPALGVPPPLLLIPVTMAASLAFMMPVGTPPNAIVFGTGLVTIPDMIRAGVLLNLAGILVNTALAFLLIGPLLAAR